MGQTPPIESVHCTSAIPPILLQKSARASNIDSRTAINAQHRFENSLATIRLLLASLTSWSFATVSANNGHLHRSYDPALSRGILHSAPPDQGLRRDAPTTVTSGMLRVTKRLAIDRSVQFCTDPSSRQAQAQLDRAALARRPGILLTLLHPEIRPPGAILRFRGSPIRRDFVPLAKSGN